MWNTILDAYEKQTFTHFACIKSVCANLFTYLQAAMYVCEHWLYLTIALK